MSPRAAILAGLIVVAAIVLPIQVGIRAAAGGDGVHAAEPPSAPNPGGLPSAQATPAAVNRTAAAGGAESRNITTGACCLEGPHGGGGCIVVTDLECEQFGGMYMGNFTTCDDFNSNGIADICESDCNSNQVSDGDDIASGFSTDTNFNGIPDECENDCNTNGTNDDIDLSLGVLHDKDQDGIPDECCPVSTIYTSMADFNQGYLHNLQHVNMGGDDCMELIPGAKAWPFVAVANSGRGTLVRIDIATGDVVGEYRTAPDGRQKNPSRTTGDAFGNVWVTNRDEAGMVAGIPRGSVTRVGLAVGGTRGTLVGSVFTPNPSGDYLQGPFSYCTCSDRDGDGYIKTSRGYTHVTGSVDYTATYLPWTNTAGADTNGGVSTAEDECITAYVRVAGTGARFLGIDKAGFVWTGGLYNQLFEKINPATALIVPLSTFNSICGGYGGLVDKTDVIWSSTGLLRYPLPAGPANCTGIPAYGVAIDPITNNIWTSAGPDVNEVSAAGVLLNTYPHGSFSSQGLVVDRLSTVWVAHSGGSTVNTVGRVMTNGTLVGTVNLDINPSTVNGRGPTGVAVDANDKVWSTNYVSNNAMRIDRTLGVAGAVDLVVDLGPGATPYNYSDMTGSVLMTAVAPQGNWTVIHDSGVPGNLWKMLTWSAMQGPGTSVMVQVRASNNPLPSGPWTVVGNGIPITGVSGRYLQVQVILKRTPKTTGAVKFCDLRLCSEPPPPCLYVTNERVQCSTTAANQFWYKFDLTNNGAFPITHVFLTPDAPIVISPNHIVLGTPLLPAQTTTITLPYPPGLTVSGLTGSQPPFCIYITAHDEEFTNCCIIKHIVDWDLNCGPGACCRPCSLGGGCFIVANAAACSAMSGTFYPGVPCTKFLCPPCIIIWDPVDITLIGAVDGTITPGGDLEITGILNTGADGMRADYGDSETINLAWDDPDPMVALPAGTSMRMQAYGTFIGEPEQLLGDFQAKRSAVGIDLKADMYMVGWLGLVQQVEVYSGGMPVASRIAGPGVVATVDHWPAGLAAGRSDPGHAAPYFSFRWATQVQISLQGTPPVVGDELRVVATNPGGPVQSVSGVAVTASGIATMLFTDASSTAPLPCLGDCTNDRLLDGADIQSFVSCFLGLGGANCTCADMDNTGSLDAVDLNSFVGALLNAAVCP